MPFRQASSNPFEFAPDGTLSLKGNGTEPSPTGMPGAYATPLQMSSLAVCAPPSYSGKCLKVIEESDSGRNMRFHNLLTGQNLSLVETVGAIKGGQFPEYDICIINGIETPRSKADGSKADNLG